MEGHDLADQTVEVGVGGTLDVQVAGGRCRRLASLSTMKAQSECSRVGVGGQDGVVGLDHSGAYSGIGCQNVCENVCRKHV